VSEWVTSSEWCDCHVKLSTSVSFCCNHSSAGGGRQGEEKGSVVATHVAMGTCARVRALERGKGRMEPWWWGESASERVRYHSLHFVSTCTVRSWDREVTSGKSTHQGRQGGSTATGK
jgi:hypothetical protein